MKKVTNIITILACFISIFLAYFALVTTSLPIFFKLLFQFMPQLIISSVSSVLWLFIPLVAIVAAGVFAVMHLKCNMDFYDKFKDIKYSHSKLIFTIISIAIAYFLAQEFLEHLSTSIIANYLSYNALVVITILAGFFSLIFFLQRGFENIDAVTNKIPDKATAILATIVFASLLTLALSTIIIIPSQILIFAQIITINLVIISFVLFVKKIWQASDKIEAFKKLLKEIIQKMSLICHATAEAMLTGKGALISTSSIIFTISVIITKTLHEILVDLVEHEHEADNGLVEHEHEADNGLVEHEHEADNGHGSHANSHNHELNTRQISGLMSLCITLFLFPLFNMPYPYFWSMIFSFVIYLLTPDSDAHSKGSELFYNISSIIAVGAIGAVAGVEASLIFNIGFIPILFATIVSILTEGNVVNHVLCENICKTTKSNNLDHTHSESSWVNFTTSIQDFFSTTHTQNSQ